MAHSPSPSATSSRSSDVLTGDPAPLAARARAFLAATDILLLPDLVVAETVSVLESFYEAPRGQVAEALRAVLAFPAIRVVDAPLLLRALEVYELARLDFAEAYLVACAETSGVRRVASFDRSLDRVSSVERVEP
ncbi:MAG TPA: PIN domain-containing protein [Mycobacteriales bacterium]|nr:PIN domain-containing protein [Mycobacteriales bacterium]